MTTNFHLVCDFHDYFGLKLSNTPQVDCFSDTDLMRLRVSLIDEEVKELHQAIDTHNFVETVDALTDILYVVYGAFASFGVNANEAFRLVHESNMSKLCDSESQAIETVEWYKLNRPEFNPQYMLWFGKWKVYDKTSGKILKSVGYKAVDLSSVCIY